MEATKSRHPHERRARHVGLAVGGGPLPSPQMVWQPIDRSCKCNNPHCSRKRSYKNTRRPGGGSIRIAGPLAPKQATALHPLHRVAVIPTAYIKSGHLLPLSADGAEADFSHSFRTVVLFDLRLAPRIA